MIYNIQKLSADEICEFKKLIKRYREFDKIDLMIHLTLQNLGVSPFDFHDREVVKNIEEEPIIQKQLMPEALKYCDGNSCEVPVLINSKC